MNLEGSKIILAIIIIGLWQPAFAAKAKPASGEKTYITVATSPSIFGKGIGVRKPTPDQLKSEGPVGEFDSISQMSDTRKQTSDPNERADLTLLRLNIIQAPIKPILKKNPTARVVHKVLTPGKNYEPIMKEHKPETVNTERRPDYTFSFLDDTGLDVGFPWNLVGENKEERRLSRTETGLQNDTPDDVGQNQPKLQQEDDEDDDWMEGEDFKQKDGDRVNRQTQLNRVTRRPDFREESLTKIQKAPSATKQQSGGNTSKNGLQKPTNPGTSKGSGNPPKLLKKPIEPLHNELIGIKLPKGPLPQAHRPPAQNSQNKNMLGAINQPSKVVLISQSTQAPPTLKPVIVDPTKLQNMYAEQQILKGPQAELKEIEKIIDKESQEGIPIKIKWEIAPLYRFFREFQLDGGDYQTPLINALEQANSIIRMFLHVPKDTPDQVTFEAGDYCHYNYAEAVTYDAHLVMVVHIMDPEDPKTDATTIAQANGCERDVERPTRGRIGFSPFKLILGSSSFTQKEDFLNTIVHETFHAIAFNLNWKKLISIKNFPDRNKWLNKILTPAIEKNNKIFDRGHWLESYLPNDVMIPNSRPNLIWTELSVDFIEYRSPQYIISRSLLPPNPLFNDFEAAAKVVNHRCEDDQPVSKMPLFCSKRQAQESKYGCSMDYTFVSECDSDTVLANNCHPFIPNRIHNCRDPVFEGLDPLNPFEKRGPSSRCFMGDYHTNDFRTAFCMEYSVENDLIKLIVNNRKYTCKESGQVLEIDFRSEDDEESVTIRCPDLERFLQFHHRTTCPEDCNHNGYCAVGKCICYDGWDQDSHCKNPSEQTRSQNLFATNSVKFVGGPKDSPEELERKARRKYG